MSASDEMLSEAIRKYPVIYDKGKKGHKNKNMVDNAWRKVIEECGIEDVASAQRLFINLKIMFQNHSRYVAIHSQWTVVSNKLG